MEEIILNASERTQKPGKFKEVGFIPGVLYGDSLAKSASVQFEEAALKKILHQHGSNAKVWIKYDDKKKFGFIKEVQKHPVSGNILHIDVQIVSKEHEIKLQVPFVFKGESELRDHQLQLQVYKADISLTGKMGLMPEAIHIDVSGKNLGDTITLQDLDLDKKLKINEKDDMIFAIVNHIRIQPVEETVEAEATAETEDVAAE